MFRTTTSKLELLLAIVAFASAASLYLNGRLDASLGTALMGLGALLGARRYDAPPRMVKSHSMIKRMASTVGIAGVAMGVYDYLALGLFHDRIAAGLYGVTVLIAFACIYRDDDKLQPIAHAPVIALFGAAFYVQQHVVIMACVSAIIGRQAVTESVTRLSKERVEALRRLILAGALAGLARSM